jgi:hypothetical protein
MFNLEDTDLTLFITKSVATAAKCIESVVQVYQVFQVFISSLLSGPAPLKEITWCEYGSLQRLLLDRKWLSVMIEK